MEEMLRPVGPGPDRVSPDTAAPAAAPKPAAAATSRGDEDSGHGTATIGQGCRAAARTTNKGLDHHHSLESKCCQPTIQPLASNNMSADSTIKDLVSPNRCLHSPRTCSYLVFGKTDFEFGATINGSSEVRNWSEIPEELLELIIQRLTIANVLCSYRVCRRWSSIVREVRPNNHWSYGLPCHISINNDDGKTCTIVDLFRNEMHIKCPNLPSQSSILFSKGGWLLMVSGDDECSIFFFDPLTKTRIDLPDFNFPHIIRVFSFSSPPTSPDCLVIALRSYCDQEVGIHLCRRGQNEWTDLGDIDNEFPFEMSYASPVFCHGSFYCLADDGRLAIFDTRTSAWSVKKNPKLRDDLRSRTKPLYVIESDGELMMVYTDISGNTIQICRLDPLTSQWKNIDTIGYGDKSLFIGHKSSICSKVDASIRNRIYFPRTKSGVYMFYSFVDRKLHPGGNFFGSKVLPLRSWIEPVLSQHSPEELKWGN